MNVQRDAVRPQAHGDAAASVCRSETPMYSTPYWIADVLAAYLADASQRSAFFLDLLRKRGDEHAEMSAKPFATVLKFDHETIMIGTSLPRPINFVLTRVIPPSDAQIDLTKRPVVIVDPRAGQRPGIGGFHYESEIGEASAPSSPPWWWPPLATSSALPHPRSSPVTSD